MKRGRIYSAIYDYDYDDREQNRLHFCQSYYAERMRTEINCETA